VVALTIPGTAQAGVTDVGLPSPIVMIDPSGLVSVDLTPFEDTVEAVHEMVPTPWGTLEFTIETVDSEMPILAPAADGGGDDSKTECPPGDTDNNHATYDQAVFGGADPPTHSGNYVYGSVTIESCTDQWMHAQVREFVGAEPGSVGGDVEVKVPAKKWVTFGTGPLACDPSVRGDTKHGFNYETRAWTDAGSAAYPDWENESDFRKWNGC